LSANSPVRRWRAPGGPALLWRRWDQQSVVFDTRSGDIHLLDPVAADVLRCLKAAATSFDELSQRFRGSLGLDSERELSEYLAKLVRELDELGLIEPVAVDAR
jgi:PqqD family protein of HPr-rel-A system